MLLTLETEADILLKLLIYERQIANEIVKLIVDKTMRT